MLLLSESYGDGHRQVAAALAAAFAESGVETIELDCMRQGSPRVAVWSERLYEWSTCHVPWLYGISYDWTRRWSARHPFWWVLTQLLRRRVVAELRRQRPDAVLQLFPERVLFRLPKTLARPWIGMVITDFSVHRRWFHPHVNTYFVADKHLIDNMQLYASADASFVDSGIPIRQAFWEQSSSHPVDGGQGAITAVVAPPYVVVATGGRGVFQDLDFVIEEIARANVQHRIVVMCGRNESMFAHLTSMCNHIPRLTPLRFTTAVAAWLEAAAFAVVKAGGVTVSECLAVGCPMLAYRPGPGQEWDNGRFVEDNGAGVVVRRPSELAVGLAMLFDPLTHVRYRQAALALGKRRAAIEVAQTVLRALLVQQDDQTPYWPE